MNDKEKAAAARAAGRAAARAVAAAASTTAAAAAATATAAPVAASDASVNASTVNTSATPGVDTWDLSDVDAPAIDGVPVTPLETSADGSAGVVAPQAFDGDGVDTVDDADTGFAIIK